ncbi:RecQ family ATP-dependent DNA helicase [Cytobacillus kochii]|uniref:RecQ family ATP-dependent DNA helicase n=1 Tax=Cytobacillus kochii TaxID=859143 RepID=UPI001CD2C91D|nr:ATP-dependent DNA helicase RecQ [Cytobacillus kochii]MCA1025640.1 ATP-dependent DNA helicase [Cytobacillus kochii]MCM3320742.1 ATP-dependent DNA helicase [Cytobacillus kochii]MCM3344424.1 ATP-dependent DNA helicase [Cytobacillus kochii]
MKQLLREKFGYTSFRDGQEETIKAVVAGKHTLAMLPTGSGKSLCYQLPTFMLPGTTLIISPLLSLMQDQVDQLLLIGEKRAIAFNSFLNYQKKMYALKNLHQYKFIFTSPEMLQSKLFMEKLSELNITLLVVDEAHCISQWGHDFRPDYLAIGSVMKELGHPPILALTATATDKVKQDIKKSLNMQNSMDILYSVDRPNISLHVEKVESYQEKIDVLIKKIRALHGPGIIYFSSKKTAEVCAQSLKENGIKRVSIYHGGLNHEERILIQQQYIHNQLDVICATSAFGMGINKENIRYVIHFHMPMNMESYLQEIGRAGRDGKPSLALLLYAPFDEQLPMQLVESELINDSQMENLKRFFLTDSLRWWELEKYEEDITVIANLSETSMRILKDFHRHAILDYKEATSLDELKVIMNKQFQLKLEAIQTVYQYIHSSTCRREKILHYFGELPTINIGDCCDHCNGSNYPDLQTEELEIIPLYENWEEILKDILLSETSKNEE